MSTSASTYHHHHEDCHRDGNHNQDEQEPAACLPPLALARLDLPSCSAVVEALLTEPVYRIDAALIIHLCRATSCRTPPYLRRRRGTHRIGTRHDASSLLLPAPPSIAGT